MRSKHLDATNSPARPILSLVKITTEMLKEAREIDTEFHKLMQRKDVSSVEFGRDIALLRRRIGSLRGKLEGEI